MPESSVNAAPLVLKRVYNAPRERVFRAWTEREELERWYTPGDGWVAQVPEHDPRPGGRYLVRFGPPGEVAYEESGEYLEVDPPARLAFTTLLVHEGRVLAETRCRVEFRDLGGQTEVVVTEEGFPPEDREDRMRGWSETLDHLHPLLEKAA